MSDFKAVEVQAISNIMGCLAHIVGKPPELWDSAGVENVLQLAAAEISKLLALGLRQRTDLARLREDNERLRAALVEVTKYTGSYAARIAVRALTAGWDK